MELYGKLASLLTAGLAVCLSAAAAVTQHASYIQFITAGQCAALHSHTYITS